MPGTTLFLSAKPESRRRLRFISWTAVGGFVAAFTTAGCTHDAPKSDLTSPDDESMLEWMAPTLEADPVRLVVPTYDGSGQSVHPDVVAFPEAWNGSKIWMTMTPYPNAEVKFENPSVLVTDDGVSLENPTGVTNPIVAP